MENNAIYLIPVTLGDTEITDVIPNKNIEIIKSLKYFIVEDLRSARRFLKKVSKDIDIEQLTFTVFDKHNAKTQDVMSYLSPIKQGNSVGVLSEAGCPAIADPGADVVAVAQSNGFKVIPLVGPSSILLSLMASGFNGQSFCFNGYLPVDADDRAKKLRFLENRIYSEDQTQIFIETPYRNSKMLEAIISTCRSTTKLCIAANITCENEYIQTKTIKDWKNNIPNLSKLPCIFLLYK